MPYAGCPSVVANQDGPDCREAGPGGICEGDGECGTTNTLNNCADGTDWYIRLD